MFNLRFQEVIGLLLGPDANEERLGVCYPALDVFENSEWSTDRGRDSRRKP